MIIMKTLSIILIVLLSTGCMTVKRIEKNCDLFSTVCVTEIETKTDTIIKTKTVIRYRDTTLYVEMPGREIIKEVPVYIKEGIVESDLSVLVTPLARSYAQVVNSKLKHDLIQTDTTLQFELQDALKTIRILNTEKWKTKEKQVVTITENSNWAKFCVKVVWVLIVIVILGIVYLILRYKNKILGFIK